MTEITQSTKELSTWFRVDVPNKADSRFIVECFQHVMDNTTYHDKWLKSECIVDLVNKHISLPSSLQFSSKELNSAISRNTLFKAAGIQCTTRPNSLGIYQAKYGRKKRIQNKKKTIHVTAYYITKPGSLPIHPGGNTKWYDMEVSDAPVLRTRTSDANRLNVPEGTTDPAAPNPSPRKRVRENDQEDQDLVLWLPNPNNNNQQS